MTMRVASSLTLFLIALFWAVLPAQGQDRIVYDFLPESKIWVEGKSNKSDWTVEAPAFSGNVKMNKKATAADPGVELVYLDVDAAALTGGKAVMDRLIQNALKAEEHPHIVYELSDKGATVKAGPNGTFTLTTKGRLNIGGVTKPVAISVQGKVEEGARVRFTGTHAMKMTDHDLTPPTAMYGALHTADDITVHFDLVAAPKQ